MGREVMRTFYYKMLHALDKRHAEIYYERHKVRQRLTELENEEQELLHGKADCRRLIDELEAGDVDC